MHVNEQNHLVLSRFEANLLLAGLGTYVLEAIEQGKLTDFLDAVGIEGIKEYSRLAESTVKWVQTERTPEGIKSAMARLLALMQVLESVQNNPDVPKGE